MTLPVRPPVAPMLAKSVPDIPAGEGLLYEPKWDGFRSIVFRDGPDVELGSRNERPLTRYFPELLEPLRAALPERCVIDGEIVIAGDEGLDFDALLQRIHPADSRVRMLAERTPGSIVAFDLLAVGDEDLRDVPFAVRRRQLEEALGAAGPPVHLTPVTDDATVAADWFSRFEGAGLDGVIAKPQALTYRSGERAMFKIKHHRTADCVVGGFRWHKSGSGVGSLLLGLYDGDGVLHHVGVTASFTAARRRELVDELEAYRWVEGDEHPWLGWHDATPAGRVPGGQSRWTGTRDLSWEVLRPELVCEVRYDQLQGDRFRHATSFARWRPDRDPRSCTYAQLDTAVPAELADVFAGGR
jgi:ATP-dependent DNA ligase